MHSLLLPSSREFLQISFFFLDLFDFYLLLYFVFFSLFLFFHAQKSLRFLGNTTSSDFFGGVLQERERIDAGEGMTLRTSTTLNVTLKG